MEMPIEEIIKYLPAPICGDTAVGKEKQKEYDAHESAIIILRKYQKIQEIMKSKKMDALNIGLLIPKDIACVLHEIKEVI